MTSLNDYLQDVQTFLRDSNQNQLDPQDIIKFINRARREIALKTQCIRILPDISAACMTASVVAAGTGYTSTPTITLSAPDFPSGTGAFPAGSQATASAIVQAGTINSCFITYGGSGYFQPVATITDATGTGGSITVQTAAINKLNQGQEVYPFSGIDLSTHPGVKSVFAVQSISVIYANYRYSLPVYAFSVYQAMVRQYPFQYQYVPTFASQFGQGTAGSFYVYPLPSQVYQYEIDAYCLPQDLSTDLDYEVIPDPWTDAVAYFASHLGYNSIQNFNASRYYLDMYKQQLQTYSNAARVSRAVNAYGRY